ncbi:MAG: winged helix-turn-helix domain-containing protein [bacterium]
MVIDKVLDDILNANSKIKILRLFINRRHDFIGSGREIARATGLTPPAAHASLKELYNQDILKREIIGKQHIYRLNMSSRIVKSILVPAFRTEKSVKRDIIKFIKKKIRTEKLTNDIVSVVLYGSMQKGNVKKGDVDIAVIVKTGQVKSQTEKKFAEKITGEFHEYFGTHLDVYIKAKNEFKKKIILNRPPISTMLKSYVVIYGKDLHSI